MSLLFKTAAEMQRLRLCGSCRCLGGSFCSSRVLSAAGGSLWHGLMIKHNQSFLETPVRTQLPQLAAGSPAPRCAALFAFYGPVLPLQ